MATQKFLDNLTGLPTLWGRIKAMLATKQDKLTAGSNVTISGTKISATNTTYAAATQSANGLMSAADKKKLDGIASGATSNKSVKVVFPASGWSSSAPYTQTVTVPGITTNDNLGAPEIESTGNASTDRTNLTNLSFISGGVTGSGSITLYCYDGKPTGDLTLYLTKRTV